MSRRSLALSAALVLGAGLLGGIVGSSVDDDGGGGASGPSAILTVPVDGLDAGKADDRSVEVPRVAVEQAAPKLERDLQSAPPGTPQDQLDAARRSADLVARTQSPLPVAGASAGFDGCRTSFVNNQSSRGGARPQWQVLHYTVSPNRPGWSDVDAVVALFNRSSSQASSNFVIDSEGHCAYIVPIEAKAWTQAGANRLSVSYEIIATGREHVYLAAPGLARLRSVVHAVARRTGIPLRRGSTRSCALGAPGIVQHKDFGICGGGHVDVAPFSASAIISQLVAGGPERTVTRQNVRTCQKINAWRRAGRPGGGAWRTNTLTRIANLKKRGVVCTTRGARRA